MIGCYVCGKEIHTVHEIGEIIRSYDEDDLCCCAACKAELDRLARGWGEEPALFAPGSPTRETGREDTKAQEAADALRDLEEWGAFTDEGIYPRGSGNFALMW